MIELKLLEEFLAVVDTGTLSKASERLHTSQPALTRSMRKLEDDLGVGLFVRNKNRLSLSETGVYAAAAARTLISEGKDFEEKVRAYERSLHTISIGFCAPVPQSELTPIINGLFEGVTLSAYMGDDENFLDDLKSGTYQLAVTHFASDGDEFYFKKCGHEELHVSLAPSHPLTFQPEIRLSDLDGLSILLFSRIGFWSKIHREKTPNANYLVQVDRAAFNELVAHSEFPAFSSSHYVSRGLKAPDRVVIPLADEECHVEFYLVCLASERAKFAKLFNAVGGETVT